MVKRIFFNSLKVIFFKKFAGNMVEIYIEINGQCIPNRTYIEDSNLHLGENSNSLIKCVLPGKRLNGGQWLRPDGQPVNYLDSIYFDLLQCSSIVQREMLSL